MSDQPNHTTLQTSIDAFFASRPPIVKKLWDEMVYLRHVPAKHEKIKKQEIVDRPVTLFTKTDRLKNEIGTEITLILRSRACKWAHSSSGGCTMCGYWNDRASVNITADNYWHQFQAALDRYNDLLHDPQQVLVFKIFTSGSYCDPDEIPLEIQLKIFETLARYPTIKEIVVESRPEFLTDDLLILYQNRLPSQYLEIGIGVETASDFIRMNLINKGFTWHAFEQTVLRVHQHHIGVKAYLLFKPPFLSEYAAMQDLQKSIRACLNLGVDSISINPTNIQIHTLCDELAKSAAFRPPWLYSLLWILKHTLFPQDLLHTRILCDPSALGKDRGIHNCQSEDPSNQTSAEILQQFIMSQDLTVIPDHFSDPCWSSYLYELLLGN